MFGKLPDLPTVSIDLRINDETPTGWAVRIWNGVAHYTYDTPKAFAADAAEYVGEKRDLTQQEVSDLRDRIADAIRASDPSAGSPATVESDD
jgi:hypothetical protein